MVSTLTRLVAGPVARTIETGPFALLQDRVNVEPGVRVKSLFVKAGMALADAARVAITDATENFIVNVVLRVEKRMDVRVISCMKGVESRMDRC